MDSRPGDVLHPSKESGHAGWERTSFGPVATWPVSFRTLADLVLRSDAPTCLFWGPEGRMLFNMAWGDSVHPVHAISQGLSLSDASPELADALAAHLDQLTDTTRRDFEATLLPLIWRGLTGHAGSGPVCTAVVDDDGRTNGVLVQLGGAQVSAAVARAASIPARNGFVLRLSDALLQLYRPGELRREGAEMLARELAADAAHFTEFDVDGEPGPLMPDDFETGQSRATALGPAVGLLRHGLPLVMPDMDDAPEGPAREAALRMRAAGGGRFTAHLSVPVLRADRLVAVMTLQCIRPRLWTADEIALVHQAATRTREALERARAEASLRLSESRHRALFESVDEGVCLIERIPSGSGGRSEYRFVAMNPSMQRMFGVPDLGGQNIRENFPDEAETWREDCDHVLNTGEPVRRVRASEPHGLVLEVFIARVEEDSGRMLIAVIQDITDRKRAEEAMKNSEARFRALVNATSYVVYRMSPDWREMRELDGRGFLKDAPEPLKDWLPEYIDPEDQPEVMAEIRAAIEGKRVFQLEHRVKRPDGTLGWTYSRAVPLLDETGEITEWFGAASDITERKSAEEIVRQTELRLRLAQEAAGVATFDWLIQTNEGRWSPELLAMLGLREGDFGGTFEDWTALIHPDDRPEATRRVSVALETGELEGEWRIVRPDGEVLWILVRGQVSYDAANRPVRLTGAQVDITERVLSEERVRLMHQQIEAQITALWDWLRSRDV
ncbi:MAG: PAS domain-containing protein [Pseudooceanicola sp.]